MTAETHPPVRRAALAFIFVTVLLDILALGIVIPVLPHLIQDFVAGNAATAAEYIGLFGTSWAIMQFFASPIIGALSDRFGRRPVILLSNLGLGLDYIVMALAPGLWWLLLGRLISGVTSASIASSYAYVADVSTPDKRAAGLRTPGRRVRPWLCARSGARRRAGRHRTAPALLGRRRHEPDEFPLRRCSCCRNHCPPTSGCNSPGGAQIPSVR